MKDLKELLIDEIYNYKENKHRNSMGCSVSEDRSVSDEVNPY